MNSAVSANVVLQSFIMKGHYQMLLCNIQMYLIIIIYDASSDWLDIHVTGQSKRRVYRRINIVFHSFQINLGIFLFTWYENADMTIPQI